jgi:hypothetical protein
MADNTGRTQPDRTPDLEETRPRMNPPRTPEGTYGVSVRVGALLALAVLLTRVPFVWCGYGTDSDTWKFASALREIADTGRYTASRLPGYPLMEWLCAPFAHLGPWGPNLLSAVAAAACAWLAARVFARHGVRDAWLAGAAFVFVPAAYIAGTSSIDYLWAIAFALAAWCEAADGGAGRAGLLLGLAVGTRITSALFVVPLAWLVWNAGGERRLRGVLALGGIGAAVGAAWYVPGFLRYGWNMFTYSEIKGGQSSALHFLGGMLHPGDSGVAWPLVAGQATVLLWGVVGSLAVGLALLSIAWQTRGGERAARLGPGVGAAVASLVLLETVVYLRLPHDEGYLLPAVPFAMLALAAWLTPARFRTVCVALLVSPFLFGVDVAPPKKGLTPAHPSRLTLRLPVAAETVVVEPFRGPLLRDLAKRERMRDVERRLEAWWPQRPPRFRLAAGNMIAMLYYLFPVDPRVAPFARWYSTAERADARSQGIPLYVLPDVTHRMRISEGLTSTAGLSPLAGAESE